jgi:MtN3 and saliva related transmembrane protein
LKLKSALKWSLYADSGGCQAGIMSHMLIDLVGYVAAILTTVAFVPQALTSWRTRDLSGVSLPMYSIFTAGVAMWLAYGVMLGSWPIIIANAVTLALSGAVLVLKVMHR